jgi:uncharacterized membrane protein YhaH (DUF805 family)
LSKNGWYYVSDTNRIGPVEQTEIDRLIATGHILGGTLIWREGLDGWEPASDHFAVTKAVSPPPIPASPPPFRQAQFQSPNANTATDQYGIYVGAPPRGFGEAISTCMNKFVTFSGRASRSEYWYFALFVFLVSIVCSILDGAFSPGYRQEMGVFQGISSLVFLLPNLAVTVRRLHDTDRSGWWIGGFWLALVVFGVIAALIMNTGSAGRNPEAMAPFAIIFGLGILMYSITLLVFICQRGTAGPNRHG